MTKEVQTAARLSKDEYWRLCCSALVSEVNQRIEILSLHASENDCENLGGQFMAACDISRRLTEMFVDFEMAWNGSRAPLRDHTGAARPGLVCLPCEGRGCFRCAPDGGRDA